MLGRECDGPNDGPTGKVDHSERDRSCRSGFITCIIMVENPRNGAEQNMLGCEFDGPNDGPTGEVDRNERDGSCRSGFLETEKHSAASASGERAEAGSEALI